jgi:hypothetical protein
MHTLGAGNWQLSLNGQVVMTINNSDRADHLPYSTILLPESARDALRDGENKVTVKLTDGKNADATPLEFALLTIED